MYLFWDNLSKFPRFFISVLTGFFLTIFNFIFESLRDNQKSIIFVIVISIISAILLEVLKLMLALN